MPPFGKKKPEMLPDRTSTHSDTFGDNGSKKKAPTSQPELSPPQQQHIKAVGDSPTAATHQAIQIKSPPPNGHAPGTVKIVPRDYFDCPMADLAILVSSMLQDLVTINDALPFDADQLTRFHSRSVPGISVQEYLVRIIRFCTLEKSILMTMIFFIDLLCKTYVTFNINSLTVHRFMITAAAVASKGLCDSFCTNSHYARVGGLSKAEFNLLEVEFLTRVDYRIVPQGALLDSYYERMVMRLQGAYAFPPLTEARPKKKASDVIKGATFSLTKLFSPHDKSLKIHAGQTNRLKRPSITQNAEIPSSDNPISAVLAPASTELDKPEENNNESASAAPVPPSTPKKLKPSP